MYDTQKNRIMIGPPGPVSLVSWDEAHDLLGTLGETTLNATAVYKLDSEQITKGVIRHFVKVLNDNVIDTESTNLISKHVKDIFHDRACNMICLSTRDQGNATFTLLNVEED
jgi:hypothetical protein